MKWKESVADEVFGVIAALRETEKEKDCQCSLDEETIRRCAGIDRDTWEIVRSVMFRAELARLTTEGEITLTNEGRGVADCWNSIFDNLNLQKVKG